MLIAIPNYLRRHDVNLVIQTNLAIVLNKGCIQLLLLLLLHLIF